MSALRSAYFYADISETCRAMLEQLNVKPDVPVETDTTKTTADSAASVDYGSETESDSIGVLSPRERADELPLEHDDSETEPDIAGLPSPRQRADKSPLEHDESETEPDIIRHPSPSEPLLGTHSEAVDATREIEAGAFSDKQPLFEHTTRGFPIMPTESEGKTVHILSGPLVRSTKRAQVRAFDTSTSIQPVAPELNDTEFTRFLCLLRSLMFNNGALDEQGFNELHSLGLRILPRAISGSMEDAREWCLAFMNRLNGFDDGLAEWLKGIGVAVTRTLEYPGSSGTPRVEYPFEVLVDAYNGTRNCDVESQLKQAQEPEIVDWDESPNGKATKRATFKFTKSCFLVSTSNPTQGCLLPKLSLKVPQCQFQLRSILLYQTDPRHYITVRKFSNRWYICDDLETTLKVYERFEDVETYVKEKRLLFTSLAYSAYEQFHMHAYFSTQTPFNLRHASNNCYLNAALQYLFGIGFDGALLNRAILKSGEQCARHVQTLPSLVAGPELQHDEARVHREVMQSAQTQVHEHPRIERVLLHAQGMVKRIPALYNIEHISSKAQTALQMKVNGVLAPFEDLRSVINRLAHHLPEEILKSLERKEVRETPTSRRIVYTGALCVYTLEFDKRGDLFDDTRATCLELLPTLFEDFVSTWALPPSKLTRSDFAQPLILLDVFRLYGECLQDSTILESGERDKNNEWKEYLHCKDRAAVFLILLTSAYLFEHVRYETVIKDAH